MSELLVKICSEINDMDVLDEVIDVENMDEDALASTFMVAYKQIKEGGYEKELQEGVSEEGHAFFEENKADFFEEEDEDEDEDSYDEEDVEEEEMDEEEEEEEEKPKKKSKAKEEKPKKEKAKRSKKQTGRGEKQRGPKRTVPKKTDKRSRYGHVQSASSGRLDDAFFEGGTVKQIMNMAGVGAARVKSHMAALRTKGITILEYQSEEKDRAGNLLVAYKAKEEKLS